MYVAGVLMYHIPRTLSGYVNNNNNNNNNNGPTKK